MLRHGFWGFVFFGGLLWAGIAGAAVVDDAPDETGVEPQCPALIESKIRDSESEIFITPLALTAAARDADIDRLSNELLELDPGDLNSRKHVGHEIDRIVRHRDWVEAGHGHALLERSVAEISRANEGSNLAAQLRSLRRATRLAAPPRRFMPRILDRRFLHPILKRVPWVPPFLSAYLIKFRSMRDVIDGIVKTVGEARTDSDGRVEAMFYLSARLFQATSVLAERADYLGRLSDQLEAKAKEANPSKARMRFIEVVVLEPLKKSKTSLNELEAIFTKTYLDMMRIIKAAEQINGQADDAILFTLPILEGSAAVLTAASQERERVADLMEFPRTAETFLIRAAESVEELSQKLDILLDTPLIRSEALLEAAIITRRTDADREKNAGERLGKFKAIANQFAGIMGEWRLQVEAEAEAKEHE